MFYSNKIWYQTRKQEYKTSWIILKRKWLTRAIKIGLPLLIRKLSLKIKFIEVSSRNIKMVEINGVIVQSHFYRTIQLVLVPLFPSLVSNFIIARQKYYRKAWKQSIWSWFTLFFTICNWSTLNTLIFVNDNDSS